MKLNGRTLVLEDRACSTCDGKGTRTWGPIPCSRCQGTGRGPRGGRGTCKGNGTSGCFNGRSYGTVPEYRCDHCDGRRTVPETASNYVSPGILASIPVEVRYADRDGSWNESYLGFGCLWSSTDYGRRFEARDDAALVAEVRAGQAQACAITRELDDGELRLADVIVVTVTRSGYAPRAGWTDSPAGDGSRELGRDAALAVGAAVLAAGGNGTMAAASVGTGSTARDQS